MVQAESAYWIPTFGVSWARGSIDVNVPPNPAIAYRLVVKAIEIWDEAQLWFRSLYFPNGKVYTFVVGKTKPAVLVEFTDYWTVSNYCPSLPLGVDGCTDLRWDDSGNITRAIVFLDTNSLIKQGQLNDSIFLVLHEVGHALGLPDLSLSSSSACSLQDLLCLYYANKYPSTLDLYALHQLAEGNRGADVSLPSNIPYAYYLPPTGTNEQFTGSNITPATTVGESVTPLPQGEMPNWLRVFMLVPILAIGTVILLLFFTKRQKRKIV
jgi:hypothetical protein